MISKIFYARLEVTRLVESLEICTLRTVSALFFSVPNLDFCAWIWVFLKLVFSWFGQLDYFLDSLPLEVMDFDAAIIVSVGCTININLLLFSKSLCWLLFTGDFDARDSNVLVQRSGRPKVPSVHEGLPCFLLIQPNESHCAGIIFCTSSAGTTKLAQESVKAKPRKTICFLWSLSKREGVISVNHFGIITLRLFLLLRFGKLACLK